MRQSRIPSIEWSLIALVACGGGSDLGPENDDTLTLEIQAGDSQVATVGQGAPDPLAVRVVTANEEPRSGVSIGFVVRSGDASLSGAEAVTDQAGVASVELTLGEHSGAVEVVASGTGLSGSPVTFHVTAAPDAPATLTATAGDGQAAFVGRSFRDPISALVTDRFGNPTPGIEVIWTVQSGGGSVSPAAAAADSEGLVAATWTAGPQPGGNLLAAQVAGGPSVAYTATGVSPGAGRLVVSPWGPARLGNASGLHLMEPEGSKFVPLPNSVDSDRDAVWSPDGSRIAFTTYRFGDLEVVVMRPDGSDLIRVAPGIGSETPGWSPDGTRIVFSGPGPGDVGQLIVANADGSGSREAIPNTEAGYQPNWSPDGGKIVFSKGADEICIVNVDGSDFRQLAYGEHPLWSPDGSKIAFTGAHPEGGRQAVLMNPDGTEQIPFPGIPTDRSAGRLEWMFQSWSPDGQKVLLTARIPFPGAPAPDEDDEFYTMNADGTGLIRITYDEVYTLGGSWGP